MFPSRVMVLKLSKKVHFFFSFMLTSARNLSILKQFTYMRLKGLVARFRCTLVSYVMVYCFRDIRVWSQRTLLNFCWVGIFFDILIANVSSVVAQTPINHTISWKSVMRLLRCIYGNCFQRLRFLAEVSTKLHEMHVFRTFKGHNSGRKHGQ